MKSFSDEQLINNYLKGDENSLEILIKRHLKSIFGFILKRVGSEEEAEDITQEVFLKVWKNIKKFDSQKSFKAWIFAIAKNTLIDFYKKKKAVLFSDFLEDTLADQKLLASESFDANNISKISQQAIERLPDKYRAIISLRYNNDLTYKEISEYLKEPLNTVKSRCRRAVLKLKYFFKS